MNWKCFFAISVFVLSVCDQVLAVTTITNVRLVDGLSPNEGRVEFYTSDNSNWTSFCGDGISSDEASVICRQLGYPGFNNYIELWPFGMDELFAQENLNCAGDEDNLSECSLLSAPGCSNRPGVICFDHSYEGCFAYPGSASDDLEAPCEDDVRGLNISNCMSLCRHRNNMYTHAGLYQGNTCLCGNASLIVSQLGSSDDADCFSQCTGRDIETCGGPSHIALFNLTQFVAGPSVQCADLTPTTTEGSTKLTTTIDAASQTTSATPLMGEIVTTKTYASTNSPETTNPSLSMDRIVISNTFASAPSQEASTQSEGCTCPLNMPKQESSSQGVVAGLSTVIVLLALYAVGITFLHFHHRYRRSVPNAREKNETDPYMDLQPRPQENTTYEDITPAAPSTTQKDSHSSEPNLLYENQNVVKYATAINTD